MLRIPRIFILSFSSTRLEHTHLNIKKLNNRDRKEIEKCIEEKLSSWKGKMLSVGDRLVLINSILTSMVFFMLSFFEVPRGVLEKIEYFRSRFFLATR
jgi:hypothetical protein